MSPENKKSRRNGADKIKWAEFFDVDRIDPALTIVYTRVMHNFALTTEGTEDVALPKIAHKISQSTVGKLLDISENTMIKGSKSLRPAINKHFLQLCVIAYGEIYTRYKNENNFLRILANAKSSDDEYKNLVIGQAFERDKPTR